MKYEYTFKEEFFGENFLLNTKFELKQIELMFQKSPREEVKTRLNLLSNICFEYAREDENLVLSLKVLFFQTLHQYAQKYDSIETYKNVLKDLRSGNLKNKLASKFPYDYKYLLARNLLGIFNCNLKFDSSPYSIDGIENLIQAKYYILKIYNQYLENKIALSNGQLNEVLGIYIVILTQLSRWSEPFYYFNILEKELGENGVIKYYKVMLLESLKEKTCLSYNAFLLLEIIDNSETALKSELLLDRMISRLKISNKQARKKCKEYKIRLPTLRKHRKSSKVDLAELNSFQKLCRDNSLFLNEHKFFCNCSSSLADTLSIETRHEHTKIEWCKEYQKMLEIFCTRFIIARNQFYKSESEMDLLGFNIGSIKSKYNFKNSLRNELLVASFKECYSILDTIGIAVLDALKIDHVKITKENNENNKPSKIYFLNMWDCELIDNEAFKLNPYLLTLYSIAKDLDNTKYAALQSFKKLRNSMEHNILIVNDSGRQYQKGDIFYISKDSLTKKCLLLLMLTKSAIFTFTYFIRRESKLIFLNEKSDVTPRNRHLLTQLD